VDSGRLISVSRRLDFEHTPRANKLAIHAAVLPVKNPLANGSTAGGQGDDRLIPRFSEQTKK
jgi:hypothetical protein